MLYNYNYFCIIALLIVMKHGLNYMYALYLLTMIIIIYLHCIYNVVMLVCLYEFKC